MHFDHHNQQICLPTCFELALLESVTVICVNSLPHAVACNAYHHPWIAIAHQQSRRQRCPTNAWLGATTSSPPSYLLRQRQPAIHDSSGVRMLE